MYFQDSLPYEYYETRVKAIRKKVELLRVCKWNPALILTGKNLMCLLPNFPETKTFVLKDASSSNRAQEFVKEDQDDIEIVPDPPAANHDLGYSGN